jgi:LuxR family maltose regulon positive regulatory protein
MARQRIPQVIDDRLQQIDASDGSLPAIVVGSAAWYAWLDGEATQSFGYRSALGTLTARRERQHGKGYWYAYRTQRGQLHKAYLGKPEELTRERLNEVAAALEADSAPIARGALSQTSPDSTTRAHEQELLATKLFIPPPAPTLVARPRLIAQLMIGVGRAVTLVSAPAGWGKTTLLSTWHADLSGSGFPLAWVSLDAGDNDPVRFWTYVLVAMNTLYDGVSDAALTLLRSPQPPPMEPVLTSLLNALTVLPMDAVLVLDDYHVIEAQPIHHALAFLLEHLPPRLHLVIATRVDPPLSLARLRVRGALTEIRATDLRFTSEEAAVFLTEVMRLPLESSQIEALEARTEGWIAGLQLAALSAQGRPVERLAQFVEAFTGSNRYVLEYLSEEVLQQQPEDIQNFLLYTSLLDRLTGPLCDAILGKDDGQATLKQLERANLFLFPLDDEQRWYRYHHLFAGVLRSRLQHAQPNLLPELHRRASAWYEQHEMLAEAVQHALAASDFEHAADLIEKSYHAIAVRGEVRTVLGWLNMLPDHQVRTRPLLFIYQADMLMHTKQLEAAEARLQDAERCLKADMPLEQRRTILGLVSALRAILVRCTGDFERGVALAHQALKLLPERVNFGRTSAMLSAAHAYLVSGDVTPATERVVAATLAPARALNDFYMVLRSIALLSRLQTLQGQLRKAATTYEEVVRVVPEQNVLRALSGGAAYYFGLGDILREWNQLDEASPYLMDGMELMRGTQMVFADEVTQGHLALARLQQARGEYCRAIATLETFAQLARQRNFVPHLVARGVAVRAQIELAQGNLAAAIHWADHSGLSVEDDLNYSREVEYLTLARVRIAQGRADPASHFLHDILNLLHRLLQDAEAKARVHSAIEILILRALALDAQGDHQGALIALERAVMLAEPEGYIRIFVDEGEPMLTLLSKLFATGHSARGYLETMLAAGDQRELGHAVPPMLASAQTYLKPLQQLLDPLSERELEVLSLMADGASNAEIAEQFVLAISTVKRHVSNIFSKLAVNSRTQAVARAREIGLL